MSESRAELIHRSLTKFGVAYPGPEGANRAHAALDTLVAEHKRQRDALDRIVALAQSPSWEIAHDALNGKLHPPSDEGKAPAAAGQNSQRRSETGDGSTEVAICPECGVTVTVCEHLRAVPAGDSEPDRARQAGYEDNDV